jgi:hypothetical protein
MAVGIGAAGILGVARETTNGTYRSPDKYVPFLSEDIKVVQSNIYRRPIRGIADPVGAVAGFTHVEGSITMEFTDDTFVYFMYSIRGDITKAGAVSPYTYTLTPNAEGYKTGSKKTMSLTLVRNGVTFGYVGCCVTGFEFTVQDGILVVTLNMMGLQEATQSTPTASWPTIVPIGPGEHVVKIPSSTPVTDIDNFTFSVDDGGEPTFRLVSGQRYPSYIMYGEREVSASLERDFESRTEYDGFKAATASSLQILCTADAGGYIQIDMYSTIKDSYEVGLSGQGDMVRASIEYKGVYNVSASASYEIVVSTTANLT